MESVLSLNELMACDGILLGKLPAFLLLWRPFVLRGLWPLNLCCLVVDPFQVA